MNRHPDPPSDSQAGTALADVLDALRRTPVPLRAAELAADRGGVPAEPGLYAWWAAARALPGVAGPAHPSSGVQLLYVGIAPSRSTSRSRLRSRVLGDHAGGSTGSSTLRRSVAAMLSEREQYRTRRTSRTVLVPEDELRLSAWMRDRLSLTWAVHPEPWSVERWVIEQLGPALNQAENTAHPSHAAVRAARARWRRSAEPADGESAGGP